MMRNMLVTGGAGFIGSNFVRLTLQRRPGVRVVVLDKLTYAGNLDNLSGLDALRLKFIKGDICDFALLDEVFRDESIDCVVNFAAESHVDRSILGPKVFIDTNVGGTFALLEAARKHWATTSDRRVFLHVSTDEVYGSLGESGYFTEETPYSPNSPYSATKAASDHLVRAYHHTYGLQTITTNCSNNYGPYQFPEKLIPLTILNALEGKPLPIYGDGRNVRDWIHVEDHSLAIDMVLDKGRFGETYNIGARSERMNIEIVDAICSMVDALTSASPELRVRYPFDGKRSLLKTFVKDRPGHDRRYAIDSSKIEREIGWSPANSFEDGLLKTVKWYVENTSWWERVRTGEYREYYEEQYGKR